MASHIPHHMWLVAVVIVSPHEDQTKKKKAHQGQPRPTNPLDIMNGYYRCLNDPAIDNPGLIPSECEVIR